MVTRSHLFLELFCDEPGCDCRRVMIQVHSDERGASQPRATLSWGWEPDQFYRDWARFPLDEEDLDELRGPGLARMAVQTEEAEELLGQFRMLLKVRRTPHASGATTRCSGRRSMQPVAMTRRSPR